MPLVFGDGTTGSFQISMMQTDSSDSNIAFGGLGYQNSILVDVPIVGLYDLSSFELIWL
jgi:hypothetical protein